LLPEDEGPLTEAEIKVNQDFANRMQRPPRPPNSVSWQEDLRAAEAYDRSRINRVRSAVGAGATAAALLIGAGVVAAQPGENDAFTQRPGNQYASPPLFGGDEATEADPDTIDTIDDPDTVDGEDEHDETVTPRGGKRKGDIETMAQRNAKRIQLSASNNLDMLSRVVFLGSRLAGQRLSYKQHATEKHYKKHHKRHRKKAVHTAMDEKFSQSEAVQKKQQVAVAAAKAVEVPTDTPMAAVEYKSAAPWFKGLHYPGHNFTGPFTRLDIPSVRNATPRNEIDAISKEHDFAYERANNSRNTRDKARQIREADRHAAGQYSIRPHVSGSWPALVGLETKMFAEKVLPESVSRRIFFGYHGRG
jgi:hypothetical protein